MLFKFVESLCLVLMLFSDAINTTSAQTVEAFDACQTPNEAKGTCIYLSDCPVLNDMLKKGAVTDEERTFLQASQCGHHDGKYLVCCPDMPTSLLPEIPHCPYQIKPHTLMGNAAAIYEAPWLAMIEYTKLDRTKDFYCGGALINNRYVLTAAHCLTGRLPDTWEATCVRLGEWNTRTNPDCQFEQSGRKECVSPYLDVPIEKNITHPLYLPSLPTSRDQRHDIALIRLAQEVPITAYIFPICLPQLNALQDNMYEQQMLNVAGWGITKTGVKNVVKLTTNLTTTAQKVCRGKYIQHRINLGMGQICVDDQGSDSCIVDSGGPLVYTHVIGDRAYYIAVGIASFGPRTCGQVGWPDVFTRVGQYMEWIRNNVEP